MTDIVPFKGKVSRKSDKRRKEVFEPFDLEEELEKDIERLRKSWSKGDVQLTREETLRAAADFYYRYPVLIEYVRDNYRTLRGDQE